MARPKPRSFAPDGQDDTSAGDPGQSAAAANSRRQSRDGSGRRGSVRPVKAADGRLVQAGKSSSGESTGIKASESGTRGFSPVVSSAGPTKAGQSSTGRASAVERAGLAAANTSPRGPKRAGKGSRSKGSQVIPEAVAQRMMRRIAIGTGVPSIFGMAVFVGSYLLVSRHILDIPPVATLLASGACFLLGVVGLSYGVLSASWEDAPGTLLGTEQLGVNISRVRSSLRAMRQGGTPPPTG